jgi:thioredoxin 1
MPKEPLMLRSNEKMGMKENTTGYLPETQFEMEVLKSKQPVLAVFETPWSRPCQVLGPVVQELASDWAGTVKVVRVNADDSLTLSLCYDIQSIPTLLFFAAGTLLLKVVGTATKDAIVAKLKASGFTDYIDTLVTDASSAAATKSKEG